MGLFLPTYFSPISQFSQMASFDEITFEVEDNFQKQSYRNRCYIYGANGRQMLNIPLKKNNSNGKQQTKDTLVDNSVKWQDQHFKTLKSSYNCSPFFEFFEDDLRILFNKKHTFLNDINLDSFLFFREALQIEISFNQTKEYQQNVSENDFRFLAEVKQNTPQETSRYIQVFDDKHGFLSNLSMLDLLFMEGPNANSFL
jgi:hypothetical protein